MRGQKSKVEASSVVWGDWNTETVRLDFDDTPLDEVKLWAFRALKWFKLDNFIILQSSVKNYVKNKGKTFYRYVKGSYLVVFDRRARPARSFIFFSLYFLHALRKVMGSVVRSVRPVLQGLRGRRRCCRLCLRWGSNWRRLAWTHRRLQG